MGKNMRRLASTALFWILLVIIFFYLVFPFYWAVNSSLKTEAQLQMTPATMVPVHPAEKPQPTLAIIQLFGNSTFARGWPTA